MRGPYRRRGLELAPAVRSRGLQIGHAIAEAVGLTMNYDTWKANAPDPGTVEDREDLCEWCEATPDQRHHPRCPEAKGTGGADPVQFCDTCGCSYEEKYGHHCA